MPTVKTNGINMYYEERGQGDPLVLIMGLGTEGSVWEEHVKAWEPHYRCILLDNRGTGRSDKPAGPYTTRMMADDAAGLMEALGIERAHVAGISMGGAIAQELVLNHPTQVRSVVLVSTWPSCSVYTANVFRAFNAVRAAATPAEFTQMVQLWIYAPPYYGDPERVASLVEKQQAVAERPVPQQAYAAQCEACITHDALNRLGRIQAPTLITVGDQDIFTPLAYSRAIHERVVGSELVVFPNCGHVHHWEDLDRFNRTVLAFLQAH